MVFPQHLQQKQVRMLVSRFRTPRTFYRRKPTLENARRTAPWPGVVESTKPSSAPFHASRSLSPGLPYRREKGYKMQNEFASAAERVVRSPSTSTLVSHSHVVLSLLRWLFKRFHSRVNQFEGSPVQYSSCRSRSRKVR